MLIMNHAAFERKCIWDENPFPVQKFISCENYLIQKTIKMQAVSHRLTNNDIDFRIEIFPQEYLYTILKLIFLHYLFNHIFILNISLWLVSHYYTVYFCASSLSCKERMQKINTLCKMQDDFSCKLVLVLHNGFMINLICKLILNACFKSVHSKIVDFMQMLWVIYIQQCLVHQNLILLYFLLLLLLLLLVNFDFLWKG